MICPRQQSFLFLEFLQVSESQPILLVFGLIKWAASVFVAHLSHKHAGRVESHQGNLSKVPPSRPSVLTKFQWLMLCSFSPESTISKCVFPILVYRSASPNPCQICCQERFGKMFQVQSDSGNVCSRVWDAQRNLQRPGPVAQLCPWWKCAPT